MKVSKKHIKDAERRLRSLLYCWEDEPELTLKELVLSFSDTGMVEPNADIRHKRKDGKERWEIYND